MNSFRKRSTALRAPVFLAAIFCLAVSESQASCTAQGGRSVPLRPATFWVSNGPWTIDPDLPVGAILAEPELYSVYARNPDLVICTYALGQYVDRHLGTPLGNSTYSTNIAGIGMRFPAATNYFSDWAVYYYNNLREKVRFVKTGTITATGRVTLTGLGTSFVAPDHGGIAIVSSNLPNLILQINPRRTCNLANRSPAVNFGQVPMRATNGVLVETIFNVSVQCAGGTSGSTPVRITFTDANMPANYTSNLSIVPANSGMTINLFSGAAAITLGPASSSAGNPGQILLGNVSNGSHQFPITTRLMRVGTMRSLPSFSASSTMTMRYE